MRLTDYIIDLGRAVAYYPNLKKITQSTTASILLCQFLYWTDKTEDGWIRKDSNDIEDETGLTYNEQRTARRILRELGLVEEKEKRLDHEIWFRINQDALNELWEEVGGETVKPIKQKPKKEIKRKKKLPEPTERDEMFPPETEAMEEKNIEGKPPLDELVASVAEKIIPNEKVKRESIVESSGDWLTDAIGGAKAVAVNAKVQRKKDIIEEIEKKLTVNIKDDPRWEKFIEFIYTREKLAGEDVSVFLSWALREGFDAMYWTPEKMKVMYPKAFVEDAKNKPSEDFVEKLPEIKEKDYAPMPRDIWNEKTNKE